MGEHVTETTKDAEETALGQKVDALGAEYGAKRDELNTAVAKYAAHGFMHPTDDKEELPEGAELITSLGEKDATNIARLNTVSSVVANALHEVSRAFRDAATRIKGVEEAIFSAVWDQIGKNAGVDLRAEGISYMTGPDGKGGVGLYRYPTPDRDAEFEAFLRKMGELQAARAQRDTAGDEAAAA
jgi:hypothetical protein